MNNNSNSKIPNIAKDIILYRDLHNYIRLLKRYRSEKISTLGFIRAFFRIYNNGYEIWMKTVKNSKELVLLNINKKAIGFDSEVLIYFEDKCHRIAEDIMNDRFVPEKEIELKNWAELMLYELQTYW